MKKNNKKITRLLVVCILVGDLGALGALIILNNNDYDDYDELLEKYQIITGENNVYFDDYNSLQSAYDSVCNMIKQLIPPIQYSIFAEAVRRYYLPIYMNKRSNITKKEFFIGYVEFCRDIILHDTGQYNAFSEVSNAFSDALVYGSDTMYLANFTMTHTLDYSNTIDYWNRDDWSLGGLVNRNNITILNLIINNCIDEIDYEYDMFITYPSLYYFFGWDYIKFPVETAFRTMGDCEDQAILTAAYLESCGFETIFAAFHDSNHPILDNFFHGALLVRVEDINNFYSKYPSGNLWSFNNDPNNWSWCFIDTTWDVPFGSTPTWLQDYINFGGINSVNITFIYSDINGIIGEDISLINNGLINNNIDIWKEIVVIV